MASQVSKGTCCACGHVTTKGVMGRHLAKCPQRLEIIEKATGGEAEPLFQLRVFDPYALSFWLDLEVKGSASLKDLDKYLRAIWLECCGHLSQFGDFGSKIPSSRKVSDVFGVGTEIKHLYDFGTTSETHLKAVAVREGQPLSRHPIVLLARNLPPEASCQNCQAPASYLCIECMYDGNEEPFLCEKHIKGHPHEQYGEPIPLVNSPRVGMCGYDGPADPPY